MIIIITPIAGTGRGIYTLVMSNSVLSIAMLMVRSTIAYLNIRPGNLAAGVV